MLRDMRAWRIHEGAAAGTIIAAIITAHIAASATRPGSPEPVTAQAAYWNGE